MDKKNDTAKRRIDYTQEELAARTNLSKSTIGNRMQEITEYYGLPKDVFHKEEGGNPRKFLPPEYTPLLEILMKEFKNNPAAKVAGKSNIDAEMVVDFNKDMLDNIKKSDSLPQEYKDSLSNQPWYEVSETIVEYLPILVNELREFIFNILSSNGNDLGQTLRYVCRELDKMNYCLCRGDFAQQNIHSVESIDNGVINVIKAMMQDMGTRSMQDQMADRPTEFLSNDDRAKLESNIRESMPDISEADVQAKATVEERNKYLQSRMPWIINSIGINNPLRAVRYTVKNGKKWMPIRKQIQNGTFSEANVFAAEISQADAKGLPVWRPNEDQEKAIQQRFLDKEQPMLQNTVNLRDIVSRMLGQVIVDYFAKSK